MVAWSDFLRCSLKYETPEALLKDLNKFVEKVENNKVKCISKILRIKNGFKNILNWKSQNDCEYVDIKINALFNNQENNCSQIVEIQLLLNFLVTAKKMGHKFYTIKRKEMFIDSIDHLIYDNNNDYPNFQTKINTLINDNDISKLSKQLFFQPNIVLSLINDNSEPLLATIGLTKQYRMYELFLNCLFHFGEMILNEREPNNISTIYSKDINNDGKLSDPYTDSSYNKNDFPLNDKYISIDINNKLYLQKYFNFSHGGAPTCHSTYLWGLLQNKEANDEKTALRLAEIIMKSNYFNGVTSNSVCKLCIM